MKCEYFAISEIEIFGNSLNLFEVILNQFVSLTSISSDHGGPYANILNHMGPHWTIQDHTGTYRILQEPTGPYGTIQDRTGPYGILQGPTGP